LASTKFAPADLKYFKILGHAKAAEEKRRRGEEIWFEISLGIQQVPIDVTNIPGIQLLLKLELKIQCLENTLE